MERRPLHPQMASGNRHQPVILAQGESNFGDAMGSGRSHFLAVTLSRARRAADLPVADEPRLEVFRHRHGHARVAALAVDLEIARHPDATDRALGGRPREPVAVELAERVAAAADDERHVRRRIPLGSGTLPRLPVAALDDMLRIGQRRRTITRVLDYRPVEPRPNRRHRLRLGLLVATSDTGCEVREAEFAKRGQPLLACVARPLACNESPYRRGGPLAAAGTPP